MAFRTAIIILDSDLKGDLPGISPGTRWATFPVWGLYQFLDLFLYMAQNYLKKQSDLFFFVRPEDDDFLHARFKQQEGLKLLPLGTAEDFALWLKEQNYEKLLLWYTSFFAFFTENDFNLFFHTRATNPIRFNAGHSSLDLYLLNKNTLLKQLPSPLLNSEANTLALTSNPPWPQKLFKDVLTKLAYEERDLEARLVLGRHPQELFNEHLILLKDLSQFPIPPKTKNILGQLKPASLKEALITEEAEVNNSFIAPGATVKGKVVNSVIFSQVVIEKGAQVYDSVIMNGHTIGKNAVIKNTLILPYTRAKTPNDLTIGPEASIGGYDTLTKNKAFARLMKNGLTIIGMNNEIPPALKIEPAVFIEADLPKKALLNYNKIERGSYLALGTKT